MNRPALISADYQAHTVEVLEELRAVIMRRRKQVSLIAVEAELESNARALEVHRAIHSTYGVILDDLAVAIQTEQERM